MLAFFRLENTGIKVKSIHVHRKFELFTESLPTQIKRRDNKLSISIKEFTDWVDSEDISTLFYQADKRKKEPSSRLQPLFIVPSFFTITIEVMPRKLKKILKAYLEHHKRGEVKSKNKTCFGYGFTKNLFKVFLKRIQFRQGKHARFQLGNHGPKKTVQDEFTNTFEDAFPKEFSLWRKGKYCLGFFEHLFLLHFEKKITITEIQTVLPNLKQRIISSSPIRNLSLNHIHLPSIIRWDFPDYVNKENEKISSDTIKVIEVIESSQDEYVAYVNRDHIRPISLNKKNESGGLIYEIAMNGEAEFSRYARGYEYIQSDKRFRLVSKSGTRHSKIIEVMDGYIIPAKGVKITLLKEDEQKAD
jgi:hypothetical protein